VTSAPRRRSTVLQTQFGRDAHPRRAGRRGDLLLEELYQVTLRQFPTYETDSRTLIGTSLYILLEPHREQLKSIDGISRVTSLARCSRSLPAIGTTSYICLAPQCGHE
jgi:hypothetical protein